MLRPPHITSAYVFCHEASRRLDRFQTRLKAPEPSYVSGSETEVRSLYPYVTMSITKSSRLVWPVATLNIVLSSRSY